MRPIKWRAPRWVWVEFEGQIAFPYGSSLEPLEMWFDQERSYLKLFFSHNSFGAKHVTVAPTKVNPSLSKDTPTCDSMLARFARIVSAWTARFALRTGSSRSGLLGSLSWPDHLGLDCSDRLARSGLHDPLGSFARPSNAYRFPDQRLGPERSG